MRDHGDVLAFAPCLPPAIDRLGFRLLYRGRRLRVELRPEWTRYELLRGERLEVLHHGETVMLTTDAPQTVACPAPADVTRVEPPRQPFTPRLPESGAGHAAP